MSGYLCIAVAAILFGVAGGVAKALFNSDISPVALTAIRAFLAAAVLTPIILATDRRGLRVSRVQLRYLLVMGVLLTLVNITFYYSISKTQVAVAIMLEYTAPVFVVLIGLGRRTHTMNWRTFLVLGLSLAGCYLLTGAYDVDFFQANRVGVLVGILCGLSFALYNIYGNESEKLGVGTTTATFYTFLISAVLWLPFLPVLHLGDVQFGPSTVSYILFIVVFATVVPYWLYLYGLKSVDAFPATVIGMLDPVIAGITAYLLVGEEMRSLQIIGVALLLGAILYTKKNAELLTADRAMSRRTLSST